MIVDKKMLGKPCAFLGQRYWYRGIITEISDDGQTVILSQARLVIQTGKMDSTEILEEEVVVSDMVVNISNMEIYCQPPWCFNELKF